MKDIARADIKPAFVERNVPVALATDENYLPYLKVAINSAIARSPGSNLDIIVLHADIPEGAILDFTAGYAGVGNASVRFVDISDELETSGLSDYKQTARLPLSSCYRLLLPRILPAYDKVVYIDVDVAVCRDLGELYSTDVGGCWFAAAKDVVYNTKPEYVSWAEKWGFAEWDGYVNTGVLVMNLERFRCEPVLDRLKEIVFEAAKWNCDQDALNFVCKGAIAPLDPRWNVQLGDYCLEKQISLIGEEMWIAHYTARQKPWAYPARRYSHLWWRHVAELDVLRLWADVWGEAFVQPVAGVPKVSVIIPVCNSARYLPEALASVLMQKDIPEIEVICIDDGSTDDSAVILDFWGKRDSRLNIIHQKNQGPGVARNAGLEAAKGEYVFFLDADDRLSSGAALRQAYERVKADDLDVLVADGLVMGEQGVVEARKTYLRENLVPEGRVWGPEAFGAGLYLVYRQHAGGVWSGAGKFGQFLQRVRCREQVKEVCRDEYVPLVDADIVKVEAEFQRYIDKAVSMCHAFEKQALGAERQNVGLKNKLEVETASIMAMKSRLVADERSRAEMLSKLKKSSLICRGLQAEVNALKASESYRVGMFVTWPARKAWGGVKCLRENGIKYTVKHAAGKVLRLFGSTCKW